MCVYFTTCCAYPLHSEWSCNKRCILRITKANFLRLTRHVFIFVFFLFPSFVLQAQRQGDKPLIIAHRGASGDAPENTIASFSKALEIGADVIELDVHQTLDSMVIVMHDEKLDRTTDKSGLIKNYNWVDIKDADAGSWFSTEFTGARIPTFEEVIQLINGRALLLIEIKKGGKYYPGIERRTLAIIQANHAESWCRIQSFSEAAVNNFMQIHSNVPVYKLVVGNIPALPLYHDGHAHWGNILKYKDVAGVNLYRSFVRKRIVKKLHDRGQQIFVWTVNEERDMKKFIALGVDGIITNYPDQLKKLLAD